MICTTPRLARLCCWSAWTMLLTIPLAGCGQEAAPPVQASGKVTIDGEPVSGAELTFQLANSMEHMFAAESTEDGSYDIDYGEHKGMPAGKYNVTIRHYTLEDGESLPSGKEGESLKSSGAAMVTSYTFDKEITGGAKSVDFELREGEKYELGRAEVVSPNPNP